ncbi:MAG: cohesin domain-containing protein [Pyrinomonadaceae bacterium]
MTIKFIPLVRALVPASFRMIALAIGFLALSFCAAHAGQPVLVQNVELTAPQITVLPASSVIVALMISDTSGEGIIAYQFNIAYDPNVLQINAVPIEIEGTISEAMAFAVNPNEPGLLRVAVYGAYPLTGAGILLKLHFTAIGLAGSSSSLIWSEVLFNEDLPTIAPVNGSVTINAPVASEVSITGNVRRFRGGVVAFARVELVGADGIYRTVMTNAFGQFQFLQVATGRSYTLSASARGVIFIPEVVNLADAAMVVDLVAQPTGGMVTMSR